ncbi:MAG: cytochrome b/b6 domain-containing protein [Brooklawnia sp.]|jgi:thiosulfate reductase cytochrome b subunit
MNWRKWLLIGLGAAVLIVGVIAGARALVGVPAVAAFVERYPGVPTMPAETPVGMPAWLGVQHFINLFLMIMIIRAGLLVRFTRRPKAYFTRDNAKFPQTRGKPTKITFNTWLHLWLNAMWALNGLVFVVALFATGQWMKVVPTSADVFPHALSVGLQYLSFNWPTENGWIHYNALQLLTYFITIFIAAPLSVCTGFRISPAWSKRWERASQLIPIAPVRTLHFILMCYFTIFITTHVGLVLLTGARRNLNHAFAATDGDGWLGVILFAVSLLVVAVGWVLARPMFLKPVAQLHGKVTAR